MSIQCDGIQFNYGAKKILENISTKFEKGYLYGILGPNGSGKTTFLRILSGLMRADLGHVMLDNLDIKKLTTGEIAKKVAVVPDATSAIFDFTVEDIVAMGRYVYIGRLSRETEEDKKIVDDILKKFNLFELKNRNYNELSAGERQKVIIARAVAQQSQIILLDEPTAHLDINYQVEFMEMLKKYVATGLVVVAILHDLNLAAQYCDEITLIHGGKIHSFGTPEKILTRENIKSVYNVDVAVRKNAFTNSIYITPISSHIGPFTREEKTSKIRRIHVVAGGGSALDLLQALQGNEVSVGVINALDGDFEFATELHYEVISEAPFSPISEKSIEELIEKLLHTDIVILANLPWGKGNIKNLEILETSDKPLLVLEKTPIETRDFSNGRATEIYKRIKTKQNVKLMKSVQEVIDFIQQMG